MSERWPGQRDDESYEDMLARQRAAQSAAQADDQSRRRRMAALVVTLTAAVVTLAVALVVVLSMGGQGGASANVASSPGPSTSSPGPTGPATGSAGTTQVVPPAGVSSDGTAVRLGSASAKVTVEVWEDYRCPYCKLFAEALEPVYSELLASGAIQLHVHPVTIIDDMTGGSGSLGAANALACAADSGKAREYANALFANQPPENAAGFPRAELMRLAGTVGGLVDDAFTSCVDQGRHEGWVRSVRQAFEARGLTGTPTFFVNGTQFNPATGIPTGATQEQALARVRENLRAAVASAAG